MKLGRFEWLDFFRGAAAVVVVAYHLHTALGIPQIRFGFLAVDLFFVLSGIVLGRRYEALIRAGLTAREFAWVRLRRLYPMVAITVVLMAAIALTGLPNRPYAVFTSGTLLSVLLLVPNPDFHGGGSAFPADPVVWSLSAEFIANAVWFGAVKFGRRTAVTGGAAAMLLFLTLAVRHGSFDIGARSGMGDHFGGWSAACAWFTVGYLISVYRPKLAAPASTLPVPADGRSQLQRLFRGPPNWLLILAFGMACAVCQADVVNDLLSDGLIVLTGCGLMAGLMRNGPSNAYVARFCEWLGLLSYPLYLVHLPASRLAEWAASRGASPVPAHFAIVLGIAILATLLNERLVSLMRPNSKRNSAELPFSATIR